MVEYIKASFWGAVARKTVGTAFLGFLTGLSANIADGVGSSDGVGSLGEYLSSGAFGAAAGAGIGVLLPILSRIAAKEAATDIPKI